MRVFFLFFFLSLPFSGGFYFSARRSSTAKARGHMRARCCVARRLWPPFPVSLSNSTPPRVRRPAPTGALHARSYRTLVALVFVLIPPSALAPWVSKSLTHSLPTPLSLCLSLSLSVPSLSPVSLCRQHLVIVLLRAPSASVCAGGLRENLPRGLLGLRSHRVSKFLLSFVRKWFTPARWPGHWSGRRSIR